MRIWVSNFRICCAFVLVAVFSAGGAAATSPNWVLSGNKANELQIKALEGDAQAGESLINHYAYFSDFREAILWGMIAIENGSVDAYYSLGYALSVSPDVKHQRRAKYLFKRCVELCDKKTSEMAKELLQNLNNPKRDWPPTLDASMFPRW